MYVIAPNASLHTSPDAAKISSIARTKSREHKEIHQMFKVQSENTPKEGFSSGDLRKIKETNFHDRFKGKIQKMGKEGAIGIVKSAQKTIVPISDHASEYYEEARPGLTQTSIKSSQRNLITSSASVSQLPIARRSSELPERDLTEVKSVRYEERKPHLSSPTEQPNARQRVRTLQAPTQGQG
jgi:hypothetical protein